MVSLSINAFGDFMLRLSEQDYHRLVNKEPLKYDVQKNDENDEKRRKYGNSKVECDGHIFDSNKEYLRYLDLKLMVKAKLIYDLRLQVKFVLAKGVKLAGETRKKPDLRYVADFVYVDVATGETIVEDVKSKATRKLAAYRNKKHLMKVIYKLDINEV